MRRTLPGIVVVLVVAATSCAHPSTETTLRRLSQAHVEAGGPDIEDLEDSCCPTGTRAQATKVQVSVAEPTWAKVVVRGTDSQGVAFGSTPVVLHRAREGWKVVASGTWGIGCHVPPGVRRELSVPASPASECEVFVPRVQAVAHHKVETATSEGVRATIAYTFVEAGYGGQVVDLGIERAGRKVFQGRVEQINEDVGSTNAAAIHGSKAITVRDLNLDGEPEVVLDMFWGGAHCCYWSEIYRWDAQESRYRRQRHVWGDPDYRLADPDGDGQPEFVTADPRFAYAFTSFAGSSFPVQVLRYDGDRLVDTTRDHPDLIAKDAAQQWRWYREGGSTGEDRGVLAAWVADQCLLDRCDAALAKLHRLAHPSAGGTKPFDGPFPRYERRLRTMLGRLGYVR